MIKNFPERFQALQQAMICGGILVGSEGDKELIAFRLTPFWPGCQKVYTYRQYCGVKFQYVRHFPVFKLKLDLVKSCDRRQETKDEKHDICASFAVIKEDVAKIGLLRMQLETPNTTTEEAVRCHLRERGYFQTQLSLKTHSFGLVLAKDGLGFKNKPLDREDDFQE